MEFTVWSLILASASSSSLENQTGEPTIIHWHGQTPPPNQDGVVETGFAP